MDRASAGVSGKFCHAAAAAVVAAQVQGRAQVHGVMLGFCHPSMGASITLNATPPAFRIDLMDRDGAAATGVLVDASHRICLSDRSFLYTSALLRPSRNSWAFVRDSGAALRLPLREPPKVFDVGAAGIVAPGSRSSRL